MYLHMLPPREHSTVGVLSTVKVSWRFGCVQARSSRTKVFNSSLSECGSTLYVGMAQGVLFSIRECGSTLYVGMAQGVSLSLYIGIVAKFENTQKTGERRLRTAEYRTILL